MGVTFNSVCSSGNSFFFCYAISVNWKKDLFILCADSNLILLNFRTFVFEDLVES